jgi:two-component system response regulator YesN
VKVQSRLLVQHGAVFRHEGFQRQLEDKIEAYLQRDNRHDRNHLRVLLAQILQLPIVFFALSGELVEQIAFTAQNKITSCETLAEAVVEVNRAMEQLARQNEKKHIYSKPVSAVIDYIQRKYQEDPSLTELAELVSMSPNYLGALFKKELGMSIVDYINECKINKSKELLETTNMKTNEIAAQVGFADHSYYSRVFRKEVGCNPKDYRKQLSRVKAGDAAVE